MANAKRPCPTDSKGKSLSSNMTPATPVKASKFQMPAARKQMGGGKKKG